MTALITTAAFLPQGFYYVLHGLGLEGWQGFVIALCIFLMILLLVMTLGNFRLSRDRKIL